MEIKDIGMQIRSAESKFNTREDGEDLYIEGYFSVFNSNYELWQGATESIDSHAFDNALSDDIRALVDHDTHLVLARNKAGTLELKIDSRGLWGKIRINPKDSDAMNLYERVKRGDVDQCSFGFDILDQEAEYREDGTVHWTIKSVKLYEVSVCTFPAYEDTSVSARKKDYEDNDVDLASTIIDALGKAIGKALDKAIVYGTGTKMPLGIVTRLVQAAQPETYSATARPWADLHESHIITGTGAAGLNLFKEILTNSGVIENDYIEDGLVWLMNKKTHDKIKIQSLDKNTNALIVAGMNNTMPLINGDIIELSFIPDDNIVFGYLPAYLLAQRAGTEIGQSEHVRFIQDQTVFKGIARYDGKPAIAEAFGVLTISSAAPTTTVTFPTDTAN